ncbi:MAG: hypothetical protein ACI4EK_04880 [Wujia sp.]
MSEKERLQQEIMAQLRDYGDKALLGARTLLIELRGQRKPDTDELLNLVIAGINWEIEVFNHCEQLINKDFARVDKSKMAIAVSRLGRILQEKDDIKLAVAIEVDFIPFLTAMKQAVA